jgi:hypothetical protein
MVSGSHHRDIDRSRLRVPTWQLAVRELPIADDGIRVEESVGEALSNGRRESPLQEALLSQLRTNTLGHSCKSLRDECAICIETHSQMIPHRVRLAQGRWTRFHSPAMS